MPSGLIVKVNNFGFDLTFTIVNADGTPRDLTNLAIALYVFTQEEDPVLLFSGSCTPNINPLTGICTYTVLSTDFSQVGTFDAEIELTQGSPVFTYLEDTETFSINVMRQHP